MAAAETATMIAVPAATDGSSMISRGRFTRSLNALFISHTDDSTLSFRARTSGEAEVSNRDRRSSASATRLLIVRKSLILINAMESVEAALRAGVERAAVRAVPECPEHLAFQGSQAFLAYSDFPGIQGSRERPGFPACPEFRGRPACPAFLDSRAWGAPAPAPVSWTRASPELQRSDHVPKQCSRPGSPQTLKQHSACSSDSFYLDDGDSSTWSFASTEPQHTFGVRVLLSAAGHSQGRRSETSHRPAGRPSTYAARKSLAKL